MKETSDPNGKMPEADVVVRPKESLTPYGPYYNNTLNGETDPGGAYSRIHDYLRSARKHIWLISGIMAVITTLAAIYMARQPDVYEAQANIQVDLESNPVLGSIRNNSVVVNAPMQDPTYFNTQMQILSSAGLLGRVVKTLDLEHNRAFLSPQTAHSRSTWESLERMMGFSKKGTDEEKNRVADRLGADSLAPAPAREDLTEINRLAPYVSNLQGKLSVKDIKDTRLIEIRFRHADPEVAAKIINAIADAYVYSNLERKTENSDKAGDFLQKRIVELQTDIRSGEERLINYAKEHQILSLDANQNTVVDRLTGLNKQLMDAENDRKLAEAAYRASLAPGSADALAEDTAGAKLALDAETRLMDLRQKRAQLLIDYTDKYPEVIEIDQQIATLEKTLKDAQVRAKSVVTSKLETHYREALAHEQSLRTAFNQQRSETLVQNEAAVNYRILQQETETNKGLLDGLLQRAKENDVIVAGTPNNIHVVDYATVPKSPVGPQRLQGVGLAMLLSFVLGIALARYLEYLDDTIHSSDDVEKVLHLPALAVIPAIGSSARKRLLSTVSALQKRNGNGSHPELLINAESRSPLAEAYRHLRTSVLLSSAGGAPQILLVTSSQPSEGKTTTVVNTALILEQMGVRVLAMDADMRRPRLHSIFDLDNQRGLSTILASNMSESEMLGVIKQHETTGVYVLTSGAIPPNPAELIGSQAMRRLFSVLKSNFTHIVIDSPPVASFTDSVLISSLVDGVLLVVHGDHASGGIVRRSRQVLQDVGAKIFGVVLNNVTLRPDDYYYYKYYHTHYYASEEGSNGNGAGNGSGNKVTG